MPANTYTLIEKIVIGATSAERITFTSIPQGYTDLKIVASVRSESPNPYDFIYGYVNGVSGIHYPGRRLRGDGSSASSATSNVSYFDLQYVNGNGATANTFGNLEIYFPNYSGSNQKSFSIDSVTEDNNTTAYAHIWSYNYTNGTSAITSIVLASGSGYFKQYSTFYLYGIAKEGVSPGTSSAPYATGGDRIVFDGTYWYHAFTSSGTFTPRKNINCDVLVVAGGGGGGADAYSAGNRNSGGGGAGGVFYATSQAFSTAQSVTIGAGGAGSNTGQGSNGSNSVFGSLTVGVGGGGGGGHLSAPTNLPGLAGGSGGGGSNSASGGASTQTGTGGTGYGNVGGAGNGQTSGGGGGAGAAGAAGSTGSSPNGSGGAGLNTWSSWLSPTGLGVSGFIAGGGGGGGLGGGNVAAGGSGGSGGGGAGTGGGAAGVAGTTNTGGGGGGGGSQNYFGGAGGSGLVIVRYAA